MKFDPFDRLVSHLRTTLPRRRCLGLLAAVGLGSELLAQEADAKHKKHRKPKKKSCKSPQVKCGKTCCVAGQACTNGACTTPAVSGCQFTKTVTLWTLAADCTIGETIEIPNGVTLDGHGKTITLQTSQAPGLSGLRAQGGEVHVKNLNIRGTNDEPGLCGWGAIGLEFTHTGGSITDVSINDICSTGILASGSAGQLLSITRVAATQPGTGTAMTIGGETDTAGYHAAIDDCTIFHANEGIAVQNAAATITNSTIKNAVTGIRFAGNATGAVTGNHIETSDFVAVYAQAMATVDVKDNIIIGPGPIFAANFGIAFDPQTAGTISGNTISNCKVADPAQPSCGIVIFQDATNVTLGVNTFPDPPGNEQNVCDNRR